MGTSAVNTWICVVSHHSDQAFNCCLFHADVRWQELSSDEVDDTRVALQNFMRLWLLYIEVKVCHAHRRQCLVYNGTTQLISEFFFTWSARLKVDLLYAYKGPYFVSNFMYVAVPTRVPQAIGVDVRM